MTISLNDREIIMVLEACTQYCELMSEGEYTCDYNKYMLETGLGSAMRKIGKGRYASRIYGAYKTVSKYPSFEEWLQKKQELENDKETAE